MSLIEQGDSKVFRYVYENNMGRHSCFLPTEMVHGTMSTIKKRKSHRSVEIKGKFDISFHESYCSRATRVRNQGLPSLDENQNDFYHSV